jgi:large conductance mechanosensitive channel
MSGFRKFLLRGNVVDLAVGIVIGAAFGTVVSAFVASFITPIVGLAAGASGDFSNRGFSVGGDGTAQHPGTLFPYGKFITAVISFVIIAAVVYFFVVLPVNKLMERFRPAPDEPTPVKDCPECLSSIPVAARKCAFCTAPQAA